MKILLTLFILLSITLKAYAAPNVAIAYDEGDLPVGNTLELDAEYVAVEVKLTSSSEDPAETLKLMSQLESVITLLASRDPNVTFQRGQLFAPPVFNLTVNMKEADTLPAGDKLYLLANLGRNNDIYTATQELHDFIAKIKKPAKTDIAIGDSALAISSPQKYRNRLLSLVSQDISDTKGVLGQDVKVSVSGLDAPVYVRKKDNKQVFVFLDYRVVYSY